MLRRLVIEAQPEGLHLRVRRWEEEEEGDEYEDDGRCCLCFLHKTLPICVCSYAHTV